MEYRKLGLTDLEVSLICLGTMTYGEQNTEKEAHQQLDYAVSEGVNFFDTAEMYAIPPREETQGKTEEIMSIKIFNTKGEDLNIPYFINPINNYLTKIILDLESIDVGTYFFSLTNLSGAKETLTIMKS